MIVNFFPVIDKDNNIFSYHEDKNPAYRYNGSATVVIGGLQFNGLKLKSRVNDEGEEKFFLKFPAIDNGVPAYHQAKNELGQSFYDKMLEAVVAEANTVWSGSVATYLAERAQAKNTAPAGPGPKVRTTAPQLG